MNIRDFFRNLCYTEEELNEIRIGGENRIFSDREISTHPLKWLKYLLLARIGLRPEKELSTDIIRIPYSERQEIIKLCKNIFNDRQLNHLYPSTLVVIKLVPFDRAGQLSNFRISDYKEIDNVLNEIEKAHQTNENEIWLCESDVQFGKLSLSGRVTFPNNKYFGPSNLEIVWYASPRLIENYASDNFPYPYVRATKDVGRLFFRIDCIYIPDKYKILLPEKKIIEEINWVIRKISDYQDRITDLRRILEAAGANELSLEFKADNGKFRFIDWDTEVEISGKLKGT